MTHTIHMSSVTGLRPRDDAFTKSVDSMQVLSALRLPLEVVSMPMRTMVDMTVYKRPHAILYWNTRHRCCIKRTPSTYELRRWRTVGGAVGQNGRHRACTRVRTSGAIRGSQTTNGSDGWGLGGCEASGVLVSDVVGE
jgi:hypothetical protein